MRCFPKRLQVMYHNMMLMWGQCYKTILLVLKNSLQHFHSLGVFPYIKVTELQKNTKYVKKIWMLYPCSKTCMQQITTYQTLLFLTIFKTVDANSLLELQFWGIFCNNLILRMCRCLQWLWSRHCRNVVNDVNHFLKTFWTVYHSTYTSFCHCN